MIPGRFAPLLFGLILSGCKSLIVSSITTLRTLGLPPGFVGIWLASWLNPWPVAFPSSLLIAPAARRLVAFLTHPD